MTYKNIITTNEAQEIFLDAFYTCPDKDKAYSLLLKYKDLLDITVREVM